MGVRTACALLYCLWLLSEYMWTEYVDEYWEALYRTSNTQDSSGINFEGIGVKYLYGGGFTSMKKELN